MPILHLRSYEEMRFAGMSQAMFEHLARLQTDEELEGWSALARGARGHVEERMEEFLQGQGYRLPPKGSEGYKLVAQAFLKANVLAIKAMQERNRGEIVDTPEVAARPLPAGRKASSGKTLAELLVRWEKERQPSAKARQEWAVVVRRFTEQHGSLPVDLIERRHVVAFKDKMVDNGASPATIRKHLGALGSLLQLAVDNGLCAANVGRGVRVRGSKVAAESRLRYDSEDLKHIFSSPVYTEGIRTEAGAGEAAYWLPLLALFTGARLEELGQARVEDVKESEGDPALVSRTSDCWYILMNGGRDGQEGVGWESAVHR